MVNELLYNTTSELDDFPLGLQPPTHQENICGTCMRVVFMYLMLILKSISVLIMVADEHISLPSQMYLVCILYLIFNFSVFLQLQYWHPHINISNFLHCLIKIFLLDQRINQLFCCMLELQMNKRCQMIHILPFYNLT